MYMVSLGAGVLVGIIYSVLQVRSPAPPLIALIGLLGMLFGEQVIPVSRARLSIGRDFSRWGPGRRRPNAPRTVLMAGANPPWAPAHF
jgi:XapX domain-containing protein